jgi:prepilin-type N-terminal cleavage/methylation domain-containing protein
MDSKPNIQHPTSSIKYPRRAFTLVELLVVITIIAILASLLMVGANAARRASLRARIKAEETELATGFEELKNTTTAYPPNCQTAFGHPVTSPPMVNASQVYTDLKRYLSQAFPLHREPDELIQRLAGATAAGAPVTPLAGGMRGGEAVVFWLGGFSKDSKYPISGEGGPSYVVVDQSRSINIPASDRHKADPIENRSWVFEFDTTRLGPRGDDGNFDASNGRWIEYQVNVNGAQQTRRINLWQYAPRGSEQPYVYFDTSRYTPDLYDPPAADIEPHIHALKRVTNNQLVFATPDKFQILHCGIDGEWGEEFERTSYYTFANDNASFLAFPNGPFTGDIADTIVNFTTESTIEDSQP